jgi:hypothetical protein
MNGLTKAGVVLVVVAVMALAGAYFRGQSTELYMSSLVIFIAGSLLVAGGLIKAHRDSKKTDWGSPNRSDLSKRIDER